MLLFSPIWHSTSATTDDTSTATGPEHGGSPLQHNCTSGAESQTYKTVSSHKQHYSSEKCFNTLTCESLIQQSRHKTKQCICTGLQSTHIKLTTLFNKAMKTKQCNAWLAVTHIKYNAIQHKDMKTKQHMHGLQSTHSKLNNSCVPSWAPSAN